VEELHGVIDGVLDCHVQKRSLARDLVVGDGCFVHAACVIEFAASAEVRPAMLTHPFAKVFGAVGAADIQISVIILSGGDIEVVHSTVLLAFVEGVWNRNGSIRLNSPGPEIVIPKTS